MTDDDLMAEARRRLTDGTCWDGGEEGFEAVLRDLLGKARAAERGRCARLVERYAENDLHDTADGWTHYPDADKLAAAVRDGREPR